jgi:GH25 family lysozyme M1 (1,4-beta-N-acetylmuramidase)
MNTKKAEQVLNRFIDFYRDVRKTSDYRGSKKDILEGEEALDFLVNQSKQLSAKPVYKKLWTKNGVIKQINAG